MLSKAERDEAISDWITKGWTVKVLKARPPFGKHHENYKKKGGK
jgi:hypothetical protein